MHIGEDGRECISTQVVEFEGKYLAILEIGGRRAWVARELGEALGYANEGKRFVTMLKDQWSDELEEGTDYALLSATLLNNARLSSRARTSFRGRVQVLFESGLHLALLKTNKEAGKRLRRFLAREVLPNISRSGGIAHGQTPALDLASAVQNLPCELQQAGALGVVELVAAEQAMGRELPALRHAVASAAAVGGATTPPPRKAAPIPVELNGMRPELIPLRLVEGNAWQTTARQLASAVIPGAAGRFEGMRRDEFVQVHLVPALSMFWNTAALAALTHFMVKYGLDKTHLHLAATRGAKLRKRVSKN